MRAPTAQTNETTADGITSVDTTGSDPGSDFFGDGDVSGDGDNDNITIGGDGQDVNNDGVIDPGEGQGRFGITAKAYNMNKTNDSVGAFADGTWPGKPGIILPTTAGNSKTVYDKVTAHGGGGSGKSAGILWKPYSHKDRKLVILVGVRGGTLTVNGIQGTYVGQTNGNRATYRFPLPGSGYGKNINVVHSIAGSWVVHNGAVRQTGATFMNAIGSTTTAKKPPKQKPGSNDREMNPGDRNGPNTGQTDAGNPQDSRSDLTWQGEGDVPAKGSGSPTGGHPDHGPDAVDHSDSSSWQGEGDEGQGSDTDGDAMDDGPGTGVSPAGIS